jgi:hypothetical protein
MDEPTLYIENTLTEESCREYESIKGRTINSRSATDIITALSRDDPKIS